MSGTMTANRLAVVGDRVRVHWGQPDALDHHCSDGKVTARRKHSIFVVGAHFSMWIPDGHVVGTEHLIRFELDDSQLPACLTE